MPDKMMVFVIMRFLHDVFTAVWIGGMVATAAAVLPAVRATPSPFARKVGLAAQQRMSVLVYIAMVVLGVTGVLLSRRSSGAVVLLSWATPYARALSIKHLLYIAMVAIAVVRSVLVRRARPPEAPAQPPKAPPAMTGEDRVHAVMLLVNIVIGMAVLFLSALTSVLGSTTG